MASAEEAPGPNTTFIPSPSFVISCACLTIDPSTSTVLLAHAPADQPDDAPQPATQARCVPQGPKNMDEGLLPAAVRHTLESTGTSVEPLRLRIPTRAGLWHYGDGHSSPRDEGEVVEDLLNTEPFAACVRAEGPVRRFVFYYLAVRKKQKKEGEAAADPEGGAWVGVGDVEEGRAGVDEEERMVIKTGVEWARKEKIMS